MENNNFKVNNSIEDLKKVKDSWRELMWEVCIGDSWLDVKIGEQIEYTWGLHNDIYKKVNLLITDTEAKIIIILKDDDVVEFKNIEDFATYNWNVNHIMSAYEKERLEAIKAWAEENLIN